MKFDIAKDIYKEMIDSQGKLEQEFNDQPTKICDKIYANAWSKVKGFVLNGENRNTI